MATHSIIVASAINDSQVGASEWPQSGASQWLWPLHCMKVHGFDYNIHVPGILAGLDYHPWPQLCTHIKVASVRQFGSGFGYLWEYLHILLVKMQREIIFYWSSERHSELSPPKGMPYYITQFSDLLVFDKGEMRQTAG